MDSRNYKSQNQNAENAGQLTNVSVEFLCSHAKCLVSSEPTVPIRLNPFPNRSRRFSPRSADTIRCVVKDREDVPLMNCHAHAVRTHAKQRSPAQRYHWRLLIMCNLSMLQLFPCKMHRKDTRFDVCRIHAAQSARCERQVKMAQAFIFWRTHFADEMPGSVESALDGHG